VTVAEAPDGSRLVVDPVRNALVFQGDAARWRALQSVLTRLDQPARQVLIEVTVAEVTLTDEFSHGVEWALRQANLGDFGGPLGALTGTVPARGVVWRPVSDSGQVRAVMNLFQNDSRVSILSTPRLMVSSGEQASIDVGTEVPILTSQATAPDLGGTTPSILQQVQYRKTGVILQIQPVVHSSQRVDLRISQEVSEAQTTETSPIASPSIFSRRLETVLSLNDGEAMLMGGLISDTRTQGGSRVPLLGDLPGLGELFRSRSRRGTRTELLVLITPYVVEDAAQARAITEALRGRLDELPR
jgi:general secretion pathway protein D